MSTTDQQPAMTASCTGWRATVPPGSYFLGDPCYAVPDALWMPLLESCSIFEQPIGTVDGTQVLAFGTAYGDGSYSDQADNTFSVDAGLIGLTPMALASTHPNCAQLESLGLLVTFTSRTVCTSADGVLRFGPHRIDTNL